MIIVTGGAGFIGSNLIRGLNARGIDNILVVDNLTRADKHRTLNTCEFSDYIDKRELLPRIGPLMQGVSAVFHQGACSDTMEGDGRYLMDNNYAFSKALLQSCQDNGVPFIYASSASVYGNGEDGFSEERSSEYPLNGYAYSKFLFDQYVRRHRPFRSPVVGLRYFNVYGPQETHKGRMATVVYQFHRTLSAEGKLELFEGSEGFRRDFIHVDDVVKVNLHFLDHDVAGIFNVGTGRAESFLRIAEIMAPLYPGSRIATKPFPDALRGKYQAYTCADLTRLRAAGYADDFIGLEAGVRSYVELLKSNDGHYRTPVPSTPR
jgi:ADP-L-glycero-D-manno-heptose 6-epimerase